MSYVELAASALMAPECVLIVAAMMAATISPIRPCGIRSMMNVGKIWSACGNAWPLYTTQSPSPTNRKSVICAKTATPLPMIATCACLSERLDSKRCTMIWSAPCDAIARNAPPIKPANIVCGRSMPAYQSIACNLPAAPARSRIVLQPPSTARPSSTMAAMPPIT